MAYSRSSGTRRRSGATRRVNRSARTRSSRTYTRKASGGRRRATASAKTVRIVIEHAGQNPVARPIAASDPDGPKRGKF